MEALERSLADTYFCNFSLFQSIPDSWALKQLFPVMPIHRLNERPSRHVVLGDVTCDSDGKPCIYDPAVYYGDREADIAMTRLFGGFGADFYAAYNAVWPPGQDVELRADLYNLYHVLNHVNLFGAGYVDQAETMIGRLLTQVSD